jgi:hypothetical protein
MTATASVRAATLLGNQVLRDLRLVKVLVVRKRRERARGRCNRRAELRVPDGPEGRAPRRTARRLDLFVFVSDRPTGRRRWSRTRCRWRGFGKAFLTLLGTTTTTTTTTTATTTSAMRLPAGLASTLARFARFDRLDRLARLDRLGHVAARRLLEVAQGKDLGGGKIGFGQRDRKSVV